jgi:hypothetical protein
VPVGFVACGFALVAAVGCSSSGKTPTIATVAGSGGVGAMPVSACSLATSKEVAEQLGTTVSGKETDYADYYKTCAWAGSGSDSMSIKIIRLGNGQMGFGPNIVGLTASVLTGLGDKATYSSGRNSSGLNESLLVANKGFVSLSIDVNTQALGKPQVIEDRLTNLARGIFTQLSA